MLMFESPIPLALYIHFPWCVKKCPYCDFNSHTLKTDLPESLYIETLIQDLKQSVLAIQDRPIISIFMGGGTPSLFSPESIRILLERIQDYVCFAPDIEITLEANPGTVERGQFQAYREAGVTRVSLGVQSFTPHQLSTLGRIHSENEASLAITELQNSGLDSYNIDLMYSLPNQTVEAALFDLHQALAFKPPHLSWYQLTLEPNTPFYHKPPTVPNHDLCADIEDAGLALLAEKGYQRYEISAFHRYKPCQHNINYWEFGDYLGIGAGAHSKITYTHENRIIREIRHKHPKAYLNADDYVNERSTVDEKERPFEYLLNTLRLIEGLPLSHFSHRTGLPLQMILPTLELAQKKGWITLDNMRLQPTPLGHRFLNDLVEMFLY